MNGGETGDVHLRLSVQIRALHPGLSLLNILILKLALYAGTLKIEKLSVYFEHKSKLQMRVNLIGAFRPNSGLIQDAMILRGLLTAVYGESVQIRKVNHHFPQCSEAEINIFIEVINPSLLPYAAKNIWIPNHEWTYKTRIPYISMVDEVWAKTNEAVQIFSEFSDKVRYIGWTSIDKVFCEKKNYSKGIVLVGKNMYRNPKPVFQAYLQIMNTNSAFYRLLPELTIPHNPEFVQFYFPPELSDKITIKNEVTNEEYEEILKEAGIAICLSAAEGFGHAVNEAMSSGCNLILSPIEPFVELANTHADYVSEIKSVEHPQCLGSLMDISVKNLIDKLNAFVYREFAVKKRTSNAVRNLYERRHFDFVERMKTLLESYKTDSEYNLADTLPKESELPDISIVTITYNRRLFMPLAKYSYMIQSYPEDKIEWVIVDDGDDPIEDTLIGVPNVNYIRLDKKTSIGEKRNIGIQSAMYDTIVMMDDDDVYPNNSILHRVAMLAKEPRKECVFCTTIPCYDIQKHISFMNVPPNTLPMSQRVSEATLAFTRSFWQERKFSDIQIAEGDAFIHGREKMCRELSPQDIIVSLVHSGNTSSRKVPEGEPNGCHYGFNEQLFAVVSEIGEGLVLEKTTAAAAAE
jgi:hypothetical protein